MTDVELINMLQKIDVVLTECHADTSAVISAGLQLIKSSFAQIAQDSKKANMDKLADMLTSDLNKSLKNIVHFPRPVAEA